VQEVDREDPGGLGVQELPPGRARPARRRIDARGKWLWRTWRHTSLGKSLASNCVTVN